MDEQLRRALDSYVRRRRLIDVGPLGAGKDGDVSRAWNELFHAFVAVKAHRVREVYLRERDAYVRLRDLGVDDIQDVAIPKLYDFDDELLVLEMEIVSPPFLLDFASAYLDAPVDFPEHVLEEWYLQLQGRFGERYTDALAVLDELKRVAGVYLYDVHADNLKFER